MSSGSSSCPPPSAGGAASSSFDSQPAKLVWGELGNQLLTTALPFRVQVHVVGEDKEPLEDYAGQLTITALTAKVCLSEGFEGRRLGLWYAPRRMPRPPMHATTATLTHHSARLARLPQGAQLSAGSLRALSLIHI